MSKDGGAGARPAGLGDEPRAARRRINWPVLLFAPSLLGLVAITVALAAGASPRRVWPVAAFLFVWASCGVFELAVRRALRLRSFRLRNAPIPRGIPLRSPLWLRFRSGLLMTGVGGILGTMVALLGFPGVAVGVLLVALGLLAMMGADAFRAPPTLTFDEAGLRIDAGAARCVVPWTSIVTIESMGPDHSQFIGLRVDDLDRVLSATAPDDPRSRNRIVLVRVPTGDG